MNKTQSTAAQPILHDEQILVVKRSLLFKDNAAFNGLSTENTEEYLDIIKKNQEFLPRTLMEQSPEYKQIIPYLIFRHQDTYFAMQRKASASEQRLKNKFTLGIGGHVRQEDMLNSSSIFDLAHREFYEEVNYADTFTITTLGLINDDSNEVGKVHIGLALLVEGNSNAITIRSELKQGTLISLDNCVSSYDRMESWSQIIIDHLKSHTF